MVTSFLGQAIVHNPQPLQRASSMVIYDINRILFDQIKKKSMYQINHQFVKQAAPGYTSTAFAILEHNYADIISLSSHIALSAKFT